MFCGRPKIRIIIALLSLAFLNFITYSLAPDNLWCYGSLLTYSQKKNNFTCCGVLHNSQQGNFFSLRDRNQQWDYRLGYLLPLFFSVFLSMTLHESEKSYMLFVCQQKCCEGIKEWGWYREGEQTNACLFVTQPLHSSTQHTHEILMLIVTSVGWLAGQTYTQTHISFFVCLVLVTNVECNVFRHDMERYQSPAV